MYDKVTFFYSCPYSGSDFGESNEIIWKSIILKKGQNKKTKHIFYEGYFRNMRVAMYENGVFISNSVSTFIYNHNANDITHLQLSKAIASICQIVECDAAELQVRGFEFGFNLKVAIEARRIIERLLWHKGVRGKQEYRSTKLTSIKFYHHNYCLKVYDKGFVEKLEKIINMQGLWIRVEEQFKLKKIPKYIKTAKDLIDPINIQSVFDEFLKQWRSIKKAPFIDHNVKTKQEIYRIYALLNPLYIEDRLANTNKEAVKKEQFRFQQEVNVGDFAPFQIIENDFVLKFQELMTNKYVPDFPTLLLVEKEGQIQHVSE